MLQVEVARNGAEVGTVRFRGIEKNETPKVESRLYKCDPKNCIPKDIARKIADRLAFGVVAGHEGDFEWHT